MAWKKKKNNNEENKKTMKRNNNGRGVIIIFLNSPLIIALLPIITPSLSSIRQGLRCRRPVASPRAGVLMTEVFLSYYFYFSLRVFSFPRLIFKLR